MIRLNLGSGGYNPPGFTPIDRKLGSEVYPLEYGDDSVDEIRASHVLEHFSHRKIHDVLVEWNRALKPGGVIKIAVPDFEWICDAYQQGKDVNIQGYLMGGHVDDDDHHGVIFDQGGLEKALSEAGFINIENWIGDKEDCSGLPVSLNVQALKTLIPKNAMHEKRPAKVSAVMSVPRLGFMDNFSCALQALAPLGVRARKFTGAFWGQCLQRCIEETLLEDDPDYILTIDYDSVFRKSDVEQLVQLANDNPQASAIASLQASRSTGMPMVTIPGPDGKPMGKVERKQFDDDLTGVSTAHFGLTIIRKEVFSILEKPWFNSFPNEQGEWGEGKIDDDIYFWHQLEEYGLLAYQANRVVIGHLELMACWPDRNFETIYQHPNQFHKTGKPESAWK